MIIRSGKESNRCARVKARYERWERRKASRFAAWSDGRRLATFVLLPSLVRCCGGVVVGIPMAWALRETTEASRGAPAPDAAADGYLMAFGYNTEEGLLPILDNDRSAGRHRLR
jgi:hypothetical protein